jgi:hypothetical protein
MKDLTAAGVKHDQGKERFDLIPPGPLLEVAKVFTYGAAKYEANNWRKGIAWGRVFAAIMRHLWNFWRGYEKDQESGLPHLAHAAWGCLVLLEYGTTRMSFDDRPLPIKK